MDNRKRTLIFAALLITCVAASFLATAVPTALPPMIKDFGISAETGQWLTGAYGLVMGITIPLTAFLITRFPTKPLYITALLILMAGLSVCLFASGFTVMLIGRILQGISNGITNSMAQVVLLRIYPPEQKGRVMGWYGLAFGASPVIAPVIAGICADTVGYRMIFVLPFILAAAALFFSFYAFGNVLETKQKKFDYLSFSLSAAAFGGVTFGIGNVGRGFYRPAAWIPLLVGTLCAVCFALRQMQLKHPFLQLSGFKNRNFSVSVLCSMLVYFMMMGGSVVMPLYVQSVLDKTATFSGLVMLPGGIAMAVASPLAGRIYDKIGIRKLSLIGAVGATAGSFGMFFLTEEMSVWIAAVLYAVRTAAIGCMMMPFLTWGITGLTKECAERNGKTAAKSDTVTAHANAVITSLRTVAGALGSAVCVGVLAAASKETDSEKIAASMRGVNRSFLGMAVAGAGLLLTAVFFVKEKKAKNVI